MQLNQIFDMRYGNSLELYKLETRNHHEDDTVNFVSRTSGNNGVAAIVKRLDGVEPFPAGTLSVALSANPLETFLQPIPYYTAFHIMVLTPKREMSDNEKLFYCMCLRKNKHKYSYGRQANKSLPYLELPEVPEWVYSTNVDDYTDLSQPFSSLAVDLSSRTWMSFDYKDIFDLKKGKRVTKKDLKSGNTPYITSIATNNGITDYINIAPNHTGNTITINYDGSVGEAYYQDKDYYALDSVNVLYSKNFQLNKYIAMFLITLMKKEKFKYNYGRKWHLARMRTTKISLPVKEDDTPDWEFMEAYIKSLPYSKRI